MRRRRPREPYPAAMSFTFPDPAARWRQMEEPTTGRRAEAARLADAARRIIDRLARVEFDEEELASAAGRLEDLASLLETQGTDRAYWGFAEAANAGDTHAFFDRSPLIGNANPLAAPVRLAVEEDHVAGTATFGSAYEGPPGCVHGGVVAAAFDLRFEGRVDRVEGRKIFTTGTCHVDGLLTAEAEGLFISVDFLKFADMLQERQP